jgi:glucose-6-phosphate 1-epimerase
MPEVAETDAGVCFRFAMSEGIWHAEVTIFLGAELEISLETKNPNEIPIVVSGALHSYLAVEDVRQVKIVGLDGAEYLDTTGEPVMRRQKGDVIFRGEVDAIYESSGSSLLVDDVSGRTLLIEKAGSPSTVVWNPWVEKAAALGDMPDDGYQKFCCIEAAIANERAVIVMPGSSHVLMTRISVEE